MVQLNLISSYMFDKHLYSRVIIISPIIKANLCHMDNIFFMKYSRIGSEIAEVFVTGY